MPKILKKKKNLFSPIGLISTKNGDKALRCICHDNPYWQSGQGEKSITPRDGAPRCTDARGSFWFHTPEFTRCIFSPGLSQQLCRQLHRAHASPAARGTHLGLQPLGEPAIPPGGHGDSRATSHSGTMEKKTEAGKSQKKRGSVEKCYNHPENRERGKGFSGRGSVLCSSQRHRRQKKSISSAPKPTRVWAHDLWLPLAQRSWQNIPSGSVCFIA